jgi:long-subunit acyl-CoA synthetase (AMP-forming)
VGPLFHGVKWANCYLLMSGYDEDAEATAGTIDSEGWLHTGDLASMREDEHFHIRGRSKEMIIRGAKTFILPRSRPSCLIIRKSAK